MTTPSLAERVERVRALADGITPGPWEAEQENAKWLAVFPVGSGRSIAEGIDPPDAALIAAAPELHALVLDLASALAVADAEREHARKLLKVVDAEAGDSLGLRMQTLSEIRTTLRAALATPAPAPAGAGGELYLNDSVKVRLSEVGIRRLETKYRELRATVPETAHQYLWPPKPGEDGMHTFQLWDLLQTFGPDCGNGRVFPFEGGKVNAALGALPQPQAGEEG